MRLTKLTALCMLFSGVVFAEPATRNLSPESQQLLNQLEHQIKGTLVAVSENERLAGNRVNDLYYSIDVPAQQDTNLGLVLDVDNPVDGYSVLSVTPGSEAESLNINAGDRILAINDVAVKNNDAALSQLSGLMPGHQLKLAVADNGDQREVQTQLTGRYVPGFKVEIGAGNANPNLLAMADDANAECGEVSVFFTPPRAKDIYSAYIHKVDGKQIHYTRPSYRLAPGKHTIHVHERIDDPFLTKRKFGARKSKPLEIDVKANMTYYIGAKFSRKDQHKLRNDQYWQPVVWETKEKNCQF